MVPRSSIRAGLDQFGPLASPPFEPMLFREGRMDISRPPHFDGTNVPYYSARMACNLDAVDLGVWRVTHDRMKPLIKPEKLTASDEKEIHLNTRAQNCLFNL